MLFPGMGSGILIACHSTSFQRCALVRPSTRLTSRRFSRLCWVLLLGISGLVPPARSDEVQRWVPLGPLLPRTEAAAIYDPLGKRLLVFGGGGQSVLLNDLWALDLAQTPRWIEIRPAGIPPVRRSAATAIYDSRHQRMIVF